MKNIRLILIMLVLFSGLSGIAQAQSTKSPLRILFVGYDVNRKPQEFRRGADEFTEADSARMPEFRKLLSEYFTDVHTIDCRDWKQEDSESYDVTIFDYPTTPIEKGSREPGNYVPDRYLPDDFSKPVVFIGSTSDIMGRRIGLKLDWMCLCLGADAHHLNTSHAIFNGPLNKVKPTLVMKETPENIYEYPSGDTVPEKIPMWEVQTFSFFDGDKGRIGLVSRGERFTDSPDVEFISSGVCTKNVTAVALGRHGNFFLWGFAASPEDMTAEAKKVFVNAVAYMDAFEGQLPIVRKYNDRMATTDNVRQIFETANQKYYDKYVEYLNKANNEIVSYRKEVEEKAADGDTLTETEKMYLSISPMEIPSYEKYIQERMGQFAQKFGNDAEAYRKFMYDNIDFMYCDPKAFFSYSIDEDVQKIGISNHSVKLLETCIKMLKDNKDPDLALRVLKRYTTEDFATAKEWKAWYKSVKDRLFFTETGGYKFMVNTL